MQPTAHVPPRPATTTRPGRNHFVVRDPLAVWFSNQRTSTLHKEELQRTNWAENTQGDLHKERHRAVARSQFRAEFGAALRALERLETKRAAGLIAPEAAPHGRETCYQWQYVPTHLPIRAPPYEWQPQRPRPALSHTSFDVQVPTSTCGSARPFQAGNHPSHAQEHRHRVSRTALLDAQPCDYRGSRGRRAAPDPETTQEVRSISISHIRMLSLSSIR